MKRVITIILLFIFCKLSIGQAIDTAFAILQPLTMATHNGLGASNNNYWVQDSSGFVQDSVTFPATRTYRFDFTGHASNAVAGVWPSVSIKINGVTVATMVINNGKDSVWSGSASVSSGRRAVQVAYTDPSPTGGNKMWMGQLYIFSSNTTTPVKYPAIVKRNLPAYGSGFITTNDFASGHLRGFNTGQIIKNGRTLSPAEWSDMKNKYNANLLRCWVTITKSGNVYTVDARNIDTLDVYIKRAKANNVYLTVVITEDNNGTYWGLTTAKNSYRDRVVDVIKRYKDSTEIAGFAFQNEPNSVPRLGEFCKFIQDIALSVRRVDTNHVIIFPAPIGAAPTDIFTLAEPLATKKVIYEDHFYQPPEITHQGIADHAADSIRTEYPNSSTSAFWNPAFFGAYDKPDMEAEEMITDAQLFALRYNVPVYVAEFGCVDYAPNYSSANWVSDAIDVFEANSWAWTITSYHTYEPWDFEIPSGKWYEFSYVKAFPQVPDLFALHQYRTDTTLTCIKLKQWFVFNSNFIPIVSFSPGAYTTTASLGRRIKLTVILSVTSTSNISVTINTANGTAVAGSDYKQISNKLFTIPAGTVSRTFCVSIMPDLAGSDQEESFTVALSNPINATLGTDAATVTISCQ